MSYYRSTENNKTEELKEFTEDWNQAEILTLS